MQLPLLTLGALIASLAFAYPFSPASPAPSAAPIPSSLVPLDSKIIGNFSHSCDQITLMNKYFLAATCSPIHPVIPGPGSGSGPGLGEKEEEPEFNQLDLNMCIGFDQGNTSGVGGMESGGGGGGYREGKLIWQALGKFANYCTDCNLTTNPSTGLGRLSELRCSCVPMTGTGGAVVTVLDLDEGVENRNGTLVCRGGMGSGIGPGPLPPLIEE